MTDPDDIATIRIFGLEDLGTDRTDRRPFQRPEELRFGRAEIPVEDLRRRVRNFVASLREILADLPDAVGEYELEQVQVSAEISAKGTVSLLGTGGELAGKSGLTFTFKKPTAKG